MRTRISKLAIWVVALAALTPGAAGAQDLTRIQLDELMTEEQRARTGVNNLTRSERVALEEWLAKYTATVAAVAREMNQVPEARGTRRDAPTIVTAKLWPGLALRGGRVARSDAGGTFLQLVDGTRWEIYLPDRPSTVTWREGDFVLVRRRPAPVGDYEYLLINGEERNAASARFAGWVATGDKPL